MRLEHKIIQNLISNEEYTRKVIPHLKLDYFKEKSESALVKTILSFFAEYNRMPTTDILKIELSGKSGLSDTDLSAAIELVDQPQVNSDTDWLIEKTESFCRDKSIYNAILQSITIIDGKDGKLTTEAIPKLLQEALAVSFDTEIGHSYIEDAAERYDFYTRKEDRIPWDIKLLNEVTGGGLPRKTLTVIIAQSGGGKSLIMAHAAANNLRQGKNVLYVTMELAEERIAERIDANLFNIDVQKLKDLDRDSFLTKIDNIAAKTHGKLIVKEYPTGSAHSGHFRGLIEELKVKQNFKPDIVYIDYLGICAAAKVKMGGSVNTYTYLKYVAEELRGLAVEYDCPVVTASQVNRDGTNSSDIESTNISDSMAIMHTADLILAAIRTDELDELNQVMFKQIKNRFGDLSHNKRFVVGLNRARMKLYDLESTAQKAIQVSSKKTYAPPQAQDEPITIDRKQKYEVFDDLDFN